MAWGWPTGRPTPVAVARLWVPPNRHRAGVLLLRVVLRTVLGDGVLPPRVGGVDGPLPAWALPGRGAGTTGATTTAGVHGDGIVVGVVVRTLRHHDRLGDDHENRLEATRADVEVTDDRRHAPSPGVVRAYRPPGNLATVSPQTNPPYPVGTAPPLTVVMPILDEERHLADAVGAILDQDYPGELEVILAVGPSTDGTMEVARALTRADARIRIVDNPTGRTPEGLNAALEAARHEVIVRVDGHGVLSSGYLARAVEVLEETGAANVGGVMLAEGVTDFERAVAVAMRSPLGVGGARFHVGGEAGPSKTVYLGVFRRGWLRRIGGYDPRYARAQDWEMNWRIRQLGGLVWFTPDLTVRYRPRSTLAALATQYRDYGRWRRVVARQHAGSLNARYLAAPVALLAVAAGAVGGLAWRPLWTVPAGYAVGVLAGGLVIGRGEGPRVAARVPAVLATMHGSWGWGFLTSPRALGQLFTEHPRSDSPGSPPVVEPGPADRLC